MTHESSRLPSRRELRGWARKRGVEDLLDSHVSALLPFVEQHGISHRLEMAPQHATIETVVLEGRTELAFLMTAMQTRLLLAAVRYLERAALGRAQRERRQVLWSTPLPTDGLSELSDELRGLLEWYATMPDPPVTAAVLTKAELAPTNVTIRGFFAGGRTPATTVAYLQDGDRVAPKVVCSCVYPAPGCEHAITLVEWLLDGIHDEESPVRADLVQLVGVPPWRRLLDRLEAQASKTGTVAERETLQERLVWRLSNDEHGEISVVPYMQKRTPRGKWTKGRRLAAGALWQAHPVAADEDRRALEILEHARFAGMPLDMGELCDALCGHPGVYDADSPTVRVELRRSPFRIGVCAVDGGERLRIGLAVGDAVLNGDELAERFAGNLRIVAPDASHATWHVVRVPDALVEVVETLSLQGAAEIPSAALPSVVDLLGVLGRHGEVWVDPAVVDEQAELPPTPVVDLAALEDGGLDVRVGILPPGGIGPALAPGGGSPQVVATGEGATRVLRRDLDAERAAVEKTNRALALPSERRTGAGRFRLADPEDALELLLALRGIDGEVAVRWDEDAAAIRVSKATTSSLRVAVRRGRSLFEIGGEVEVDGASVALAAVVDAVRRGHRWVQLGPGRFARIERGLRERLASVERVAGAGERGGLAVGALAASRLGELLGEDVRVEGDAAYAELLDRVAASAVDEPAAPDGLEATLRSYQHEGYRWLARLARWGAGAVLADDMGLGKTVQTLALLLDRASEGPALVVAPTSVCAVWASEAARFTPGLDVRLYRGAERREMLRSLGPGTVLVTSYGVLGIDVGELGETQFATLVVDEAQAVKNPATRRAKAVREIAADVVVALTGTPLENHLGDLWSIFRITNPGLLGSWKRFRERFAAPVERDGDAAALADLRTLVRPFLLRRTKAAVAPELPPRTEVVRWVQLSGAERARYESARREILERLAHGAGDEERFAVLAAITRLRQLACHPRLVDRSSTLLSSKLETALELLDDLERGGQRTLVFSQFTSYLGLLQEQLDRKSRRYLYLDGATPAEQRDRQVEEWRTGRPDLFLVSLKAGGTGLNLTGADTVLHLDPWWNPAVEDQATDRTHRIGQERPVTVVRLIAEATIEEAVLELHQAKRELAHGVLEGAEAAGALSAQDLVDLIRAAGNGGAEDGAEGHERLGDDHHGKRASDAGGPAAAAGSGSAVGGRAAGEPCAEEERGGRGRSDSDHAGGGGAALDLEGLVDLVAELRDLLDEEVAAGRLARGSARSYMRVIRRFLQFADRDLDGKGVPRPMAVWAADYRQALASGRFEAPASDGVVVGPALSRLERLAG